MKKRKAILAVLISFILTILVVEPVWATTISDLEDQKRQLEEEKRRAAELKQQEQEKQRDRRRHPDIYRRKI